MKVVVSACLLGQSTRWDGLSKTHKLIAALGRQTGVTLIAFCPEDVVFGTPRPYANLFGGDGHDALVGDAKVINSEGACITEGFVRGARQIVALAKQQGANFAVLTEKSPSCGVHLVHCGEEKGSMRRGMGVAAAALQTAGVEVCSSEDYATILRWIKNVNPSFQWSGLADNFEERPAYIDAKLIAR